MKKLLYLLLFLPVLGWAQSRYGVEGIPMCWTTALGVDSSINRYVIISSTGKPVQTIVYENARGVVVNVSGGSLKYGYCDCGSSTNVPNNSIAFSKLTQPVKDSFTVYYASTAQIAAMPNAFVGQRLKLRNTGVEYMVRSDSVAGYRVDGQAVVKITSVNRYAVIEPGELGYDIRGFGAVADDGVADDVPIQRCIDFCILNQTGVKSSTVVVPPGVWRLDKGVVIAKKNGSGALTFVGVNILGTGITPYSAEPGLGRQSILEVRNKQGFGVGILKGRNCSIKNIAFQGFSPAIFDPINATDNQWTNNGEYSNKQFAPYSAIAVDFASNVFDSDAYQDFPEYYGATATSGGSSQTQIDNIVANRFTVAIAYSISKNFQNGDNLYLSNVSTQCCRVVLAMGQDQTRGCSFQNAYLLFQKRVLDCSSYGVGTGTPPVLRDLNIAGGTQTAFVFGSGNRAHFVADNVYAESLWQLVTGSAAPITFTNSAFDFQYLQRQPDYHVAGNVNFDNCALKFYGLEDQMGIWVDGLCRFNQCLLGARGVYRMGSNSGGERTDHIRFVNCSFSSRDRASDDISSTKVLGNQLLDSNINFLQAAGYPMETNRFSTATGTSVEVFNQPYQNIREFGVAVKSNTTRTYIVSTAMRGVVKPGDAISTLVRWPSQNPGIILSPNPTPLGTVSTVSGDTVFMNPLSVPVNVRDTTGVYIFVQSSPSSNLPVIASWTSGTNYLLVKTPIAFTGELRPSGVGIPQGAWVTRVSVAGDTLFLSINVTATRTNAFVSFFNSRRTAASRSATEIAFNVGDKVLENGVEYICTTAGKNGSSVTPVFSLPSKITTSSSSEGLEIVSTIPSNAGSLTVRPKSSSIGTPADFNISVIGRLFLTAYEVIASNIVSGAFGNFTTQIAAGNSYITNLGQMTLYAANNTDNRFIRFGLNGYKSAIYGKAQGSWSRHSLWFALNNASDGSEVSIADTKFVMDESGKFGVGTTSPSAQLHVVGDCIVTSTIWLNAAKTIGIFTGSGTPEGSVTASPGSTYHDTTGKFFLKQTGTGTTGWFEK